MKALMIPSHEMPEFAGLPGRVRDDVRLLMVIFWRCWFTKRPLAALSEEAEKYHHKTGFARKTLITKYYAWRKQKDWHVLINQAKLPVLQRKAFRAEFIDYWKSLCERNQRKCRPAYRELIRRYRNNDEISGYGRWQDAYRTKHGKEAPEGFVPDLPDGWAYATLMRYAPSKFELTAARIGRSAASVYKPLVFTTRVGLECGQYLVFDDLEHDVKVNLLGVNKVALRPLELCCLDLFSACKIAWGMKPMIIGDDGTKEKIKEREMRFLLAYIMTRIGYRPAGTTLLVEHGTAAIREPIEKILNDASDGAITVERSPMQGAPAIHGYYEGRGKGNFRFKAALESLHNLTHNELAMLPGQMGKDRDHSPEELHGRERVNNALIKAMAAMPEARRNLLRLPFLSYFDFEDIANQVNQFINERTEHKLEGWIKSRLVTTEFRLGTDHDWLPAEQLLTLPEHEREATNALVLQPGNTRVRKMSPAEVWGRGKERFARLPGLVVPQILGEDLAAERKVGKNGLIEFEDRELGYEVFRYLAAVRSPDGAITRMAEGEKVLAFVNPFDPEEMHVCRAGTGKGAYMGVCKRWNTPCKADTEAVHQLMGAAAHEEKEMLAGLNARASGLVAARNDDEKHNQLVLAGAPVTEAEKEKDARIRRRIRSAEGNIEELIGTEVLAGPVRAEAEQEGDLSELL